MATLSTGVARGNIFSVSATGNATASFDYTGNLAWPNSYGSPFPGAVATANLSGPGSSTLSFAYNSSFDYDPWKGDRLILNFHNAGSQALAGISLLLTNSYSGSHFYPGDVFAPGLGDYDSAASPWPTFTYNDYYSSGSNSRITETANSISYIFASPLQAGQSISTYLPILYLDPGGGIFDLQLEALHMPEPSSLVIAGIGAIIGLGYVRYRYGQAF